MTEHDETAAEPTDAAENGANAEPAEPIDHEPLTVTYERLRHSEDPQELGEFARRPLPDRNDAAAFSRATALLEAVAGNHHTALEDRIYLAQTMPFPNVLVKLSEDPESAVRKAVAENTNDKNWLVGRLTKDDDDDVRAAALANPKTSWKMRMEGAEDDRNGADVLERLSHFGVDDDKPGPDVLTAMIRRAVALNPNTGEETLTRLADDPDIQVRHAVERRRGTRS
ncbi:AbrB family transcriptional regulator [Bifidobacterium sp. 82T24]|uniref:AbrB family transcriptional regulator n=1 Tax=Bifidobacterium pluvialisilvae TaxID=2834436 RepID=UPI001C584448|nr:AbrB family transcriptional regulator [Bifidobacterium pluvialisilvae]MBW3087927.1 AbrB family transcriptional regulator [Bifidobacterium pluvialisilvae]